jgi:hypothetical protein
MSSIQEATMQKQSPYRANPAIVFFVLCIACQGAWAQELTFDNRYRSTSEGFEWRVFATGDPSLLQQVSCIEYTLHPSFRDPVQRKCRPSSDGFQIRGAGGREFTILIKITWLNRPDTRQSYSLDLHSSERRE